MFEQLDHLIDAAFYVSCAIGAIVLTVTIPLVGSFEPAGLSLAINVALCSASVYLEEEEQQNNNV